MRENSFQSRLIRELKDRFRGCIVLKNDPTYCQGVPDLIILYKNLWAALECKKDSKAKHRPNQDYYVNRMKAMGFAEFIHPGNIDKVLSKLEQYFTLK